MQQQFVPPQQKLNRAIEQFKQRNLPAAEASCREVLADQPYNADALHLFGLIAHEVGQKQHAIEFINRAIALQPNTPSYRKSLGMVQSPRDDASIHFDLGNQQFSRKEFSSAESSYERALKTNRNFPAAANNMGIAMMAQGKVDRAIAAFRLATQLKPDFADAYLNLGRALREKGEADSAIPAFQSAIRINPSLEDAHLELAQALNHLGQFERALSVYRDAIRLNPGSSNLHAHFADALLARVQLPEAVAAYRAAIRLNPSTIPCRINLGAALRQLGDHDQAIAILTEATQLDPKSIEAFHNLGNALRGQNRLDEAAAAFERALELNPNQPQTLNSLGTTRKDQGHLERAAICFREAINRAPDFADPYENLMYSLCFHPDHDDHSLIFDHARWREQFADPLKELIRPHTNDRNPDRKLRIGYVSPDFFSHCQSLYTIPLLANQDKQNFEITCYASVKKPDALTSQIQSLSDRWRNILGVSDDQAAEMIRQDQIDILVDLTLHMADNRLMIFARKPAPVQVTWLGYPGTTGLRAMDYRLTDPYLDPAGTDDLYVEKSIRLPDSFWCYDPLTEVPAVNAPPVTTNGYITFGCLNNFCKINEPVLNLWAKVLRAVPDSRLLILANPGGHCERIVQSMQRHGIDAAKRIRFVPKTSRGQYLEYFHQIDIALDTFPYNGHTTSLDGFWMGVPLVTLVGQTIVGRAGLCQLTNLSLTELIAKDKPEFIRIATDLAGDIPRLQNLRSNLRSRMQASPLMDAPRFARNIEQAYRNIWRRCVEKNA